MSFMNAPLFGGGTNFNLGGNLGNPNFSSIANYASPTGSSFPAPIGPGLGYNGDWAPNNSPSALNPDAFKLGWNIDSVKMGLQGLATIANIWNASKMMGLARDQFNFTKDIGNANLMNSIKSYNTNLTDRATSRGVMQSQSAADVQKYIDANKLTR